MVDREILKRVREKGVIGVLQEKVQQARSQGVVEVIKQPVEKVRTNVEERVKRVRRGL